MVRGEFDKGTVSGEMRLEQLVLQLEPSAAQQAELDALVERSMIRHRRCISSGLTPQEYGGAVWSERERFGRELPAGYKAWVQD